MDKKTELKLRTERLSVDRQIEMLERDPDSNPSGLLMLLEKRLEIERALGLFTDIDDASNTMPCAICGQPHWTEYHVDGQ